MSEFLNNVVIHIPSCGLLFPKLVVIYISFYTSCFNFNDYSNILIHYIVIHNLINNILTIYVIFSLLLHNSQINILIQMSLY